MFCSLLQNNSISTINENDLDHDQDNHHATTTKGNRNRQTRFLLLTTIYSSNIFLSKIN